MKIIAIRFAPFALMLMLGACNFFAPQAEPLDLLESNDSATEIAALRSTATVETDRMMGTIEAVETSMRAVELQSTRIASTLIARGTPFIDASGITPFAPFDGNVSPDQPPGVDDGMQPLVTPGGGAQGNSALATLNAQQGILPPSNATPTPIVAASNATPTFANAANDPAVQSGNGSLTNITTARAVGADDCPTGSVTSFTTADTEIYVTATAQNVPAGSVIVSRWLREGAEVALYDWSPSFDLADSCIWFYNPAGDTPFSAGSWTVELSIDGAPAGSTTFTMTSG